MGGRIFNVFPPGYVPCIDVFIPGKAIPKGQPRTRTVRLKDGRSFAQTYTPARTRNHMNWVAAHVAGPRIEGPLRVDIIFRLPRPKSRPKRDLHPDRRPDIDNLVKAVLDGLVRAGRLDDGQIVELHVRKEYAGGPGKAETGAETGTVVVVAQMVEGEPGARLPGLEERGPGH